MKRLADLAALAATLFIAACGTSTGPGGGGGSANGPVQAVFTGDVTGTATTVVAGAEAQQASNTQITVSLNASSTTGYPSFQATIELTGYSLNTGTYTNTDATYSTGTVSGSPQEVYQLLSGSIAGSSAQGTFTLKITSTGYNATAQGVTVYQQIHGTFDGTFPAANGSSATGSTTVSVNF